MSAIKREMKAAAKEMGLSYSGKQEVLYGYYREMPLALYPEQRGRELVLVIRMPFDINQAPLSRNELEQAASLCTGVSECSLQPGIIESVLQYPAQRSVWTKNLRGVLDAFHGILAANRLQPVCSRCGEPLRGIYAEGDEILFLCENCAGDRKRQYQAARKLSRESGNFRSGMVGLFAGALVGILLSACFSAIDWYSPLLSIAVGYFAMRGYSLMDGKFPDAAHILGAVALALLMVYFENRMDWAVRIYQTFHYDWDVNFLDSYMLLPELIREGSVNYAGYCEGLFEQMLFGFLSCLMCIIPQRRNEDRPQRFIKLK